MPKFKMTKAQYAKYKKVFVLTENTVLAALLFKFSNDSMTILCYKLISSYLLNMADIFFSKA